MVDAPNLSARFKFTKEQHVKHHIKRLARDHGWFGWMPPANTFGVSGISDHHFLRDGVFVAIEAKFGANKPTEQQKNFLRSVNEAGGMAFVVNEANIGWLAVWFQAFDKAVESQQRGEDVNEVDGAALTNAVLHLSTGYEEQSQQIIDADDTNVH